MIYVLCSGGLGNQMFQYAFMKHLIESGRNASLDISYFKHNDIHSGYTLKKAFGIEGVDDKDHFDTFWEAKYALMARLKLNRMGSIHMEKSDALIEEGLIRSNAVLYGFWQGEQFFKDVSDKVKGDFSFINTSERTQELSRFMADESSIAVHIRRGDYLKNPKYLNLADTHYYHNAMTIINERFANPHFYVFSDDITWCQKCGLFNGKTTYVDHNDGAHAYEDMYLMSQARAVITANSSFSWWGGYLGNHEFVIRPEKYLTNWSDEQDKRLYPKEWIVGRIGG